MLELELPRLVGTRDAVSDLLAEQGLPSNLAGQDVVVLGRALASGSSSFADQLVHEVLEVRGANRLILVGSPSLFKTRVREAAERRCVDTRLREAPAAEVHV